MKIIYKNDLGGISIINPFIEIEADNVLEFAKSQVLAGKAFKIINDSDLPEDRSQRDNWTIADSELTDGIGERV